MNPSLNDSGVHIAYYRSNLVNTLLIPVSVQKKKKKPKTFFFVEKVTNLSIWDYKSQVLHLSNLANKNTEHPVKFEKLSDELL